MIVSLHDRHKFLTEGTLAADSAGHEVHKMYERSHIVLAGAGLHLQRQSTECCQSCSLVLVYPDINGVLQD